MKYAELAWTSQRETLPRVLEQKRLEVKKARLDDERADESLSDLQADRAKMVVASPADGRVYHGEIEDGRWNPANAAKFMKVGGKIPPMTYFASVIPNEAKLHLSSFVDETVATRLQAGQSGYVAPTSSPRSRLQVSVAEVAAFPGVDDKYHVVLQLKGPAEGFQLVPGMKGKAKISAGDNVGDSLAIPANALHEEADGSYTVKLKDGEQTRDVPVTVGAESDGHILVLSGLEAGQVIVTPDSKPAEPQK
jgi:multidrug efflux pump subunit AcrA (membrane-fusion protein)